MPTLIEALENLGIDYADEIIERKVKRCINVADAYLKGSIGENYPKDDPRVTELANMIISELYDNRGVMEKVAGNVRRLFSDMSLQLKLELSRKASESEEV